MLPGLGALLFSISACENKSKTEVAKILPQYQLTENKDTLNYVDINGLKQGHWIMYETAPTNLNISVAKSPDTSGKEQEISFSGLLKTEEGYYKNDKRTGYWKHFAKDGTVKDSVKFN